MKKARRKTVVALILAVLMVTVVFAGCKPETEEPAKTAEATKAPAAEETKAAEESQEPEPEAKLEKITLGTRNFYTSPELADMMEAQFLNDTGVELEIRHIPQDDSTSKIASMFMAGDIQDVMHMSGGFISYAMQELIYDVRPYYEENEVLKAIGDENPAIIDAATVGDALYGISTSNFNTMNMWIRDDLRKEMGVDMPTSMDELVDLLRAYQTNYPDMIPLTAKNMVYYLDVFASYFGARTRIHIVDGVAVDPVVTPEYKNFMDFWKSLYDEKLINQNMPTEGSYGAVRTQFHVGEAASILMWADIYDNLTKGLRDNGHAEDPDIYDKVTWVPPFDGPNGTFGFTYTAADSVKSVTKNTDMPKEVFDTFFEWYIASPNGIISSSRGVEGYCFDVVDGQMVEIDKVGYHGQSLPPVNLSFVYPFKFDPITQHEYDFILEIFDSYYKSPGAQTTMVPVFNQEYTDLVDDWEDGAYQCFWKYVLGEWTYEEYLEEYGKLASDWGLEEILANIKQ